MAPVFLNCYSAFLLKSTPTAWKDVEEMLSISPCMELCQSWNPSTIPGFAPAHVFVFWTKENLIVAADLSDEDVFNPVTGFNERAFLYGDVLEVFINPNGSSHYYEIHAAPSGSILQLKFDCLWRMQPFERQKKDGELIDFPRTTVKIEFIEGGWRVLMLIPWKLLDQRPRLGEVWRISTSRYDYTRGQAKPVLSSTSQLPRPDFHMLDHYNSIRFDVMKGEDQE